MVKRKKKTPRPSMKDVARLAGVSQTTVSFVVNDTPEANSIPEETQARVRDAVRDLSYRPNALARALRSERTQTIGFISDEVATTPFAVQLIHGAQDLAWANEHLLLLVNTDRDPEMKEAAIQVLLDRQVDGIIYAAMYHREVHPPESIHEVPSVLLNCYVADQSLVSVVPDEIDGGRRATEYLLAHGHRRIGFINNTYPVMAATGRLEGYRQALAANEVPFDERLVCTGISEQRGGYDGAMELLQRSERPTALFCYNDRMAMGAYDAIRKLGLSIPDDVAVIGYDNHEIIAANLYPALTTMELPFYQMGKWAGQQLLRQIERPEAHRATPIQDQASCPLIERDSV